jgi:hypothetical protein
MCHLLSRPSSDSNHEKANWKLRKFWVGNNDKLRRILEEINFQKSNQICGFSVDWRKFVDWSKTAENLSQPKTLSISTQKEWSFRSIDFSILTQSLMSSTKLCSLIEIIFERGWKVIGLCDLVFENEELTSWWKERDSKKVGDWEKESEMIFPVDGNVKEQINKSLSLIVIRITIIWRNFELEMCCRCREQPSWIGGVRTVHSSYEWINDWMNESTNE